MPSRKSRIAVIPFGYPEYPRGDLDHYAQESITFLTNMGVDVVRVPSVIVQADITPAVQIWKSCGISILPLSKPALATVGLFTFIANWQDFLGPLIYIRDESQYTLSLGLQSFLGLHGAEWAKLMAASTLTILPIVIIFFLAQRTFIEGTTFSGLKE